MLNNAIFSAPLSTLMSESGANPHVLENDYLIMVTGQVTFLSVGSPPVSGC